MKVLAHRSYRVAMRRQSLSLPNMISTLWRWRLELLAVSDRGRAIGATGDAWSGAACAERLMEPVGIVAAICDQHRRVGHGGEHQRRALVVADLALGEQQDARPPALVADRVELGVQVAFGAADTSG